MPKCQQNSALTILGCSWKQTCSPLFSAKGLGREQLSWLTAGMSFQRQKRLIMPWKSSPRRSWAGFTHTQRAQQDNQCLLLAISSSLQQREGHRNPLHTPGFFKGLFVPDLTPLLSDYTNLNFLPGSVLSVCHCAFIAVNCLLISGQQLHFPHHWDYVRGQRGCRAFGHSLLNRGAHWFNYKSLHCAESSEFLHTTTSNFHKDYYQHWYWSTVSALRRGEICPNTINYWLFWKLELKDIAQGQNLET